MLNALSQAKLTRNDYEKVKFPPLTEKIKGKFTPFFGKYQKYLISCVENICNFTRATLVLRSRKITDIFNTFDEICLVFTSKKEIFSIY